MLAFSPECSTLAKNHSFPFTIGPDKDAVALFLEKGCFGFGSGLSRVFRAFKDLSRK